MMCYLNGLSRPKRVVYFVRQILGMPVVSKEVLSQRTNDYRNWVEERIKYHDGTVVTCGRSKRRYH